MAHILVDSNVLLDILTQDEQWSGWSAETLERYADSYTLAINPIIYSEVSIRFERIEELEAALPRELVDRLPIPWEAAFLAGKCFLRYRRAGGPRLNPLPDFFIGAHAAVAGLPLITRNAARYQAYFPTLQLIAPE
ncbi:MAG: type II toxin-antitoxin system VapC family toxin [Planctomycetes bacterium]|nr:type II toxin-antitoxin system VapC family toxin [Planctomycetota bacterium]